MGWASSLKKPPLDDLLLPWSIDLSLRHELPEPLRQHVARVGRRFQLK